MAPCQAPFRLTAKVAIAIGAGSRLTRATMAIWSPPSAEGVTDATWITVPTGPEAGSRVNVPFGLGGGFGIVVVVAVVAVGVVVVVVVGQWRCPLTSLPCGVWGSHQPGCRPGFCGAVVVVAAAMLEVPAGWSPARAAWSRANCSTIAQATASRGLRTWAPFRRRGGSARSPFRLPVGPTSRDANETDTMNTTLAAEARQSTRLLPSVANTDPC